jgi:putative cardiolipin synthase
MTSCFRFAVSLRRAWPVLLLLAAGCAQLPPQPAAPPDLAMAAGTSTELDQLIAPALERRPGQSGFRLVGQGPEAFALRAHVARIAGRSVDVQTYIWHGDQTGMAMAQVLLMAADRGVKVRLLLDYMDARAKNDGLAALDAHPNIAVRMFNPLASRSGAVAALGDMLGDAKRLNRRMHNKTWIADNRIAVVGGRNLGDEYFGASEEVNFVDLDFAMVGPVVQDASASFDRYWNSQAAYPIAVLSPDKVNAAALDKLRGALAAALEAAKQGAYAELLRRDDAVTRLVNGDWPMSWSSEYRFVADDPDKIYTDPDRSNSDVLAVLAPVLRGARQDLTIVSPYFVPRDAGTKGLVEAAQAGKRVRVLTNSLAANDVAAVHGGYSEYREQLLEGGVQLWELKPTPGVQTRTTFFGSGGASLHTKGLAVDGETLFVGSYNLDPRSTSLNCEQGVLVKSDVLAQQFLGLFDLQSSGTRAWRVSLVDGDLAWTDGMQTYDKEPEASGGRKFQAWVASWLPIESQL